MPMNDLALKAISEETRRKILRLVRDQPASVKEISTHFDSTQQAISQHLRVLKDAGLVDSRRIGTRHLYVVRTEGFAPVAEFLEEFWPDRLQTLKSTIEGSSQRGRRK